MGSYTRIAGAGTGAVLLALWLGVSTEGAGGAAQLQQAPNVTTDTRLTCHDQTTETRLQKHHGECQSCHTGGNAHAVAPEKGNIGGLRRPKASVARGTRCSAPGRSVNTRRGRSPARVGTRSTRREP